MDKELIIRAIQKTLDNWSRLNDKQKGKDFEKSRINLESWLNDLKMQSKVN